MKAANLFHFAIYTQWPEKSLNQNDTLHVTILGEDPFGPALEKNLDNKTANNHPIALHRIEKVSELDTCHILFISKSHKDQLDTIFTQLENKSVLTVSDIEDFTQEGGMIQFYQVVDRVKFKINIESVQQAGLNISSYVLQLATIVKN